MLVLLQIYIADVNHRLDVWVVRLTQHCTKDLNLEKLPKKRCVCWKERTE